MATGNKYQYDYHNIHDGFSSSEGAQQRIIGSSNKA
jgi:hypothetical protein